MKYFLTGATGFIGGHVARQLVAAGHEVHVLVRTPSKAQDLADLGITIHPGDITDKESMREPMQGMDGVFHIAAWYKVGAKDKSMAQRINVAGTRNVLELMRELEIPRGVYTSTLAIFSDTQGQVVDENYYFDPEKAGGFISEYDRTKWVAHYEVALPMIEEGLPLTIVMPGVVYGPGDTSAVGEALVQYLEGKLPVAPKQTAYTWAHVEDIARAHILAMESGQPGETYIIAGDVRTFIQAFELAEEVSGIPAPRLRPGPGVMKFMAGVAGVLNNVFPLPQNMHPESLRAIAGVTYLGDNAKARRELGYAPRPFEEGWPETVRHEMQSLGMEVPQK